MKFDFLGLEVGLHKLNEELITKLYKHSFLIEDQSIHVCILKMDGSNFIWVGSDSVEMKSISITMQTPFDSLPTSLQLLGETRELANSFSQTISKLFVKQTGGRWLASFNATNIPSDDRNIRREILEELKSLIKSKPEWFK